MAAVCICSFRLALSNPKAFAFAFSGVPVLNFTNISLGTNSALDDWLPVFAAASMFNNKSLGVSSTFEQENNRTAASTDREMLEIRMVCFLGENCGFSDRNWMDDAI
jgi:hypothetical protein